MEANSLKSTLSELRLIETADGSPSLFVAGEGMHNTSGALSETLHVYGPAIDRVFEARLKPRFLVAGLGLGYIEFLILARARLGGVEPEIVSFETRDEFKTGLRISLEADVEDTDIFSRARQEMEQVTGSGDLREPARQALKSSRWQIKGELESHADVEKVSAILYDPFSRQTTPQLWDESFLAKFIESLAAGPCVFATYASFGSLKRVLTQSNFTLETRAGFAKKRECTLAVRLDSPSRCEGF